MSDAPAADRLLLDVTTPSDVSTGVDASIARESSAAWYRSNRFYVITLALIVNFWASGVVFGFTALKPMLIDSDVFVDKCPGGVDPGVGGQAIVTPPSLFAAIHAPAVSPYHFPGLMNRADGSAGGAAAADAAGAGDAKALSLGDTSASPLGGPGIKNGCTNQLIWIDLMFTVLSSALNFFSLPFGVLIDKLGPRSSTVIGCTGMVACSVLFAFSLRWGVGLLTMVSYTLMGIMGCDLIYLAMFKLIHLFPASRAGLVNSLFLCTWELSAFVLFAGQVAFYHTSITLFSMFIAYAILVAGMALLSAYTLPSQPIMPLPEPAKDGVAAAAADAKANGSAIPAASESSRLVTSTNDSATGIDTSADGKPQYAALSGDPSATINSKPDPAAVAAAAAAPAAAHDEIDVEHNLWQALKLEYTKHRFDVNMLFFWLSTYVIGHYFYMSNAYEQLIWIQGGVLSEQDDDPRLIDRAQDYAAAFAIMFPVLGATCAPTAGMFLDKFGLSRTLLFATVLEVVFGVCSCIPVLELQYVTFASMICCRSMIWLMAYVFLSSRINPKVYATFFGILCSIAGCVNLLGFLFTYLAEVTFGFNFLYLNIGLCVACVVSGTSMTVLYWK